MVETDEGMTGLVLLGRGEMRFHPARDREGAGPRSSAASETLETRYRCGVLRFNPADFEALIAADRLLPRAVDPRELRRAEEVFREDGPEVVMPSTWATSPATPGRCCRPTAISSPRFAPGASTR